MTTDKAAAIERLNARIKLNEERIAKGEYDMMKLVAMNLRLERRVLELELESN